MIVIALYFSTSESFTTNDRHPIRKFCHIRSHFRHFLNHRHNAIAFLDPQLGGACTGPLGQDCAAYEWIELMLVEASKTPGTTIRELAAAITDRLIAEPTIREEAELAAIASVMQLDPATKMSEVDTGTLEAAARRFAGLILNTPQFMLSGVPSRDRFRSPPGAPGPQEACSGGQTAWRESCWAPPLPGNG
jgi:hypothetical protein